MAKQKLAIFYSLTFRIRLDWREPFCQELVGLSDLLATEGYTSIEVVHPDCYPFASPWPHKLQLLDDHRVHWAGLTYTFAEFCAEFDVLLILPTQESLAKSRNREPNQSLPPYVAERLSAWANFYPLANGALAIVQDPREHFVELYLELYEMYGHEFTFGHTGKWFALESQSQYLRLTYAYRPQTKHYDWGLASARYTPGNWYADLTRFPLQHAPAQKYLFAFQGFQFGEFRQQLLAEYLADFPAETIAGIGRTEPTLPSVTENQLVDANTIGQIFRQSSATMLLLEHCQISSNYGDSWYTPRFWEGMVNACYFGIPEAIDPLHQLLGDTPYETYAYFKTSDELYQRALAYNASSELRKSMLEAKLASFLYLAKLRPAYC